MPLNDYSADKIALCKVRFERATEDLEASLQSLKNESYRVSANRSYYAVFHAMRAVNCLDGYDSKKHSGVIQHFNRIYIKQNHDFASNTVKIISDIQRVRESSDYDDFYICSKEKAELQYHNAKQFVSDVENYIKKKLETN